MSKVDTLKSYVPQYLLNDPMINAIFSAQGAELDTLTTNVDAVLAQFTIDTATWGLSIWEQCVGIATDVSKTYETRRSDIKSKLQGINVCTLQELKNVVNLFNLGNSIITEDYANYLVNVQFDQVHDVSDPVMELEYAIERIKPAHIFVNLIFNVAKTVIGMQEDIFYNNVVRNTKLGVWHLGSNAFASAAGGDWPEPTTNAFESIYPNLFNGSNDSKFPNLITNPTMTIDTGGDGVADGWTPTANSGITGIPSIEDGAQKLTITNSTSINYYWVAQTFDMVPSEMGSGNIQVRVSGNTVARLVLTFLDSSNAYISNSGVAETSSTSYVTLEHLAKTAPANTAKIRIEAIVRPVNIGDTGSAWFKNAILKKCVSIANLAPLTLDNNRDGLADGWSISNAVPAGMTLVPTIDNGQKLEITVCTINSEGAAWIDVPVNPGEVVTGRISSKIKNNVSAIFRMRFLNSGNGTLATYSAAGVTATSYTKSELANLIAPATAAKIRFFLVVKTNSLGALGTAWFQNIVLKNMGVDLSLFTNLIPYPGLNIDTDGDGIVDGWLSFATSSGIIASQSLDQGAQKTTIDDVPAQYSGKGIETVDFIAVTPGRTLVLSVDTKITYTGLMYMGYYVVYYNSASGQVSNANSYVVITNGADFANKKVILTVPSDGTIVKCKVKLYMYDNQATHDSTGSIWFKNASLKMSGG